MAKRFTDTDKWKREWFSELDLKAKLVWLYLIDQCDHCGIWPRNLKLLFDQTGVKVTERDLVDWFGPKLVKFDGDKYFIPSFFEFQYGKSKEGFKARTSAVETLQSYGLMDHEGNCTLSVPNSTEHLAKCPEQSPDCPSIGIGKSIGIGNKEGGMGETIPPKIDLEVLYRAYPLKKGKEAGLKKLKAVVKTQADFDDVARAIERYKADLKAHGTEAKFIKHFSTFMTSWRDWLDPETGKSESFGIAPIDYSKIFGEAS